MRFEWNLLKYSGQSWRRLWRNYNPSVTDFTTVSIETPTVPGAGSVPTGDFVTTWGDTHMHLDVAPSWSVPLPNKARDSNALAKGMADLISVGSLSHPSASHAVNVSSPTGSDVCRPLVVSQAATPSGVAAMPVQERPSLRVLCLRSRCPIVVRAPHCQQAKFRGGFV